MKLDGEWKVKDFSIGEGTLKKVYQSDFKLDDFIPIQIPGTVRQALLKAGKIPDPYFGYNNEQALWVEQREWWLVREFIVSPEIQDKLTDLIFEGTVFQGEAWLNANFIGNLEGMFNPRSFPVSALLKFNTANRLAVRLEAPEDARRIKKLNGLSFDCDRDQLYSIAQCLFGWDWAPHTVPIGIWRPVRLRSTGMVRIANPVVRSTILNQGLAELDISCELVNLSNSAQKIQLDSIIRGKNFKKEDIYFQRVVSLAAGETKKVRWQQKISQPELWWPNAMGEQHLYELQLEAKVGQSASDRLSSSFGIREIKLVENENSRRFIESMKAQTGSVYHLGKAIGAYPWTFQVNGQKMFAKGANWIPADHLLRLTPQRYRRLLQLAKDANFNLLRIWGGGLYETDDFYQLCDELGILTWQEFLSNKNFSKINRVNFLEGVRATILRIRNHPSLSLYCGGNEFDPDDHGSKQIIDELEKMIRELDPDKEFHRASPYMGDDHYWGVWHGKEPYTRYRIVRPFRSEAGVNTFPVIENYRKFTPAEKLWPPDEVFIEYHGENRGKYVHLDKLNRYADEFGDSASIEEFIRKSQLYQALANAFNMEFCRAHKFENSGLLFWQYNDSWPCISWSIVDWYGTPKPAYYWIKRACQGLHLCFDFEKYLWQVGEQFRALLWLLNDNLSPARDLHYKSLLLDINGNIIISRSGDCRIEANFSEIIDELNWRIADDMSGATFFIATLLKNIHGDDLSGTIYPIAVTKSPVDPDDHNSYHAIFSELNRMAQASVDAVVCSDQIQLTAEGVASAIVRLFNNSAQLAFFIRLRFEQEFDVFFADYSDNYFSLLPGEMREIEITLRQRHSLPSKAPLTLIIDGWNCAPQRLALEIR